MGLRYYQREAVDAMLNCSTNDLVVLPTGSGKSHVIRGFCEEFKGNILVISHKKEILEQDFNILVGVSNVGLYSAGLGVKHIDRITVAGIQSIYRKPELFKDVDVVLIDEAHTISNVGMYGDFLKALGVRYLGVTATPFRTDTGYLFLSGLFDKVCYEAGVDTLTTQGFLSPLVLKADKVEYDTNGLTVSGGDFKLQDMVDRFDRDTYTDSIVQQLLYLKETRKHWLVFCIDINHAENVANALNKAGIATGAVHSKMDRDQTVEDFKSGKLQAVTNVNILTIGFDFPDIDLLVILRPTQSPVLHVQSMGRGTRITDGKVNCLVKDFSGNVKRLGTISNLNINLDGKYSGGKGEQPMKSCPDCDSLVNIQAKSCDCGHTFKFKHGLKLKPFEGKATTTKYRVNNVRYYLHRKVGKPDSVKVSYQCGCRIFNEWVLLQHPGYASRKAFKWIKARWFGVGIQPYSAATMVADSVYLRKPSSIEVKETGKFPEITKHFFEKVLTLPED